MKPSVVLVFLVVMASLTGAIAQADVIFDNFGPGDTYNVIPAPLAQYETDWLSVGGLFNQDYATQLGPVSATCYLTSVDLAISTDGPTDTAYIYLMSGSPEPTAIVDYAVYDGLPTWTGVALPPISVPFDSYELVPGQTYWIVVSTVDVHLSAIRWGTNSTGMTGGYAAWTSLDYVGVWTMYEGATPAMRVNTHSGAVPANSGSWGSLKALFH